MDTLYLYDTHGYYDPRKESEGIVWELPDELNEHLNHAALCGMDILKGPPTEILLNSQRKLIYFEAMLHTLQENINKYLEDVTLDESQIAMIYTFLDLLKDVSRECDIKNIIDSNYVVLQMIGKQRLINSHTKYNTDYVLSSVVEAYRLHSKKLHSHDFRMSGKCTNCPRPRDVFIRRESKCKFVADIHSDDRCYCAPEEPYPWCSYCTIPFYVENLVSNSNQPIGTPLVCFVRCLSCRRLACPFDFLTSSGNYYGKYESPYSSKRELSDSPKLDSPIKKQSHFLKSKIAAKRKCGVCGKEGHYQQKCPEKQKVPVKEELEQFQYMGYQDNDDTDFPPIIIRD